MPIELDPEQVAIGQSADTMERIALRLIGRVTLTGYTSHYHGPGSPRPTLTICLRSASGPHSLCRMGAGTAGDHLTRPTALTDGATRALPMLR